MLLCINATRSLLRIPTEPSYLILNIDLSTRWGWPYCPTHCDCACVDCSNASCTVRVARGRVSGPWDGRIDGGQGDKSKHRDPDKCQDRDVDRSGD